MKQRRRRSDRTPDVNLNLNVRGMTQSATVAINDRSNQMRREGRHVYKLGLGQSPFPVPAPVVEELRTQAFQKDYLPVAGLPELREAVAEYHRRTQGLSCTGTDILIGPGSKELMFLLQLVYYGDLVIPTPAWVSYAPQANIIGRKIAWTHASAAHQWHLTAADLDALCAGDPQRPRIAILNYPNNPTGATYRVSELEEIADIARAHRLVLLSDEIYAELHHDGQHVSIARFYPEGTIVSSGLSKWCGAGGWRLGTFAFPHGLGWLRDAMAAVASETFTSTSAPIQYAAVRAFTGGLEIERYLATSRWILRALGRWGAAALSAADIAVEKPRGGFYLLPDFSKHTAALAARGITTSVELCDAVLEQAGVAILPGTDFGRQPEELLARIAYVDFDGARALTACDEVGAGAELDDEFLESYMPNVTGGITRLCEWVTSARAG